MLLLQNNILCQFSKETHNYRILTSNIYSKNKRHLDDGELKQYICLTENSSGKYGF